MDERRKTQRTRPERAIIARLFPGDAEVSVGAVVEDASNGGLGLSTLRPLTPDSPLGVELPSAALVAARVAHATVRPDGTWRIGCKLLADDGQDILGLLA